MKKLWFHRGMYIEGLRRLRTHGVVALVLCTVFEAFPLMMAILFRLGGHSTLSNPLDFLWVHPSLYYIPVIFPMILMAEVMKFQNSRRDSDFYHSLPVTKTTLTLSFLAAAMTWCAIVIVGSSFIIGVLAIFNGIHAAAIGSILLCTLGALTASLFTAIVIWFAYALSGTKLTATVITLLILFAPRATLAILVSGVLNTNPVLPDFDETIFLDSLFFAQYDSVTAWIVTILGTVVFFIGAVYLTDRRPSEAAGSSAVSAGLQHTFRIWFAMCCSIPAIICLSTGYTLFEIGIIYIFVIVAYFLFEIITTKTAKHLVKTIPWLGVVAALNVVSVVGLVAVNNYIYSVRPTPDQIDSISVVELIRCQDPLYDATDTTYIPYDENGDELSLSDISRSDIFDRYSRDFGNDAVIYSAVRLTDDASKQAVSQALAFSIDHADQSSYYNIETDEPLYLLQVTIRMGATSVDRRIWATQEQFDTLMDAVHAQHTIPAHRLFDGLFQS